MSLDLNLLVNLRKALDEAAIIAITDRQGIITYANEKFLEMSKYSREELIGSNHRILNSGHHSKKFFQEMWRTIETGNVWTGVIKNRAKDGSLYWVTTTIVPFLNKKGIPYQYIAIRTDITRRIETEQELQSALENDFQKIIKQLNNLIFKIKRKQGMYTFIMSEGKIAEEINFTTDFVKNKPVTSLLPQREANILERNLDKVYKGKHAKFEIKLWGIYFLVHLSPVYQESAVDEVLGVSFDISDRKKDEEKIKYMAYHDLLTGLPNRFYLLEKMGKWIISLKSFALIFLDLNQFKNINDTLGHAAGDELLKSISKHFLNVIPKNGIVSRFEGDEFIVLLPESKRNKVARFAQRLLSDVNGFYTLNDSEIYISVSLGISMYPNDGMDANKLIKHANVAMHQEGRRSQSQGENAINFFNTSLKENLNERMLLETDLRKAIDEEQFSLVYQPQVDIRTNKIVGVEALLRWHHPKLGLVSPMKFIPLAEETGLIIPIGRWVLKTASEQVKNWHNAGYSKLKMAINISIYQFMDKNFIKLVNDTIQNVNINPKYLELEITESIMIDVQYAVRMLSALQNIGVKVSIDDFGSGYSSLNYLSESIS